MYKTKHILTILATVLALTLTSCLREMEAPVEYGNVQVELVQEPSVQTKSTVTTSETAVNNVTFIIFDHATGLLQDAVHFAPASAMKLEKKLLKGKTYDVYAVANFGDISAAVRSTYKSKDDFLASYSRTFSSFGAITASGIPMASSAPVTVTPSGANESIQISVERLLAKYIVNIDRSALNTGSTITVKSVAVKQAALTMMPFAQESARKTTNVSSGDYATAADITALNNGNIATFYIPENRQGVLLPGNTNPWNKIPGTEALKNACTYLEIVCSYAKTDKEANNATYRMYLGSNATTDFSVARNTTYTLTLKPTDAGIDQSSWKLDPGEIITYTHEVKVEPAEPKIKWHETQAFTAKYYTYKYIDGQIDASATTFIPITADATWTSSNETVATMSGATATALAKGTSTIKATYTFPGTGAPVSGTATLTVEDLITYKDEIEITGPATVEKGETADYVATKKTYRYVNDEKDDDPTSTATVTGTATWSSGDTSIATVSGGAVTGVAVGQVTITASTGTGDSKVSGTKTITVEDKITYEYELEIKPASASIKVDETQDYTAKFLTYKCINGVRQDSPESSTDVTATYTSKNTGIATVSGATATGVAKGTATIEASYTDPVHSKTVTDTATLTVEDNISYSHELKIDPSETQTIKVGETQTYTATYYTYTYINGNKQDDKTETEDVSSKATWSPGSGNTSKVSFSGSTATGNVPGTYTITASYKGEEKSVTLKVENYVVSYEDPVVTAFAYDPTGIPWEGGYTTPKTVLYSQKVNWAYGDPTYETTEATRTYSGSAPGFELEADTGKVTATSKNTGDVRSITVTVTVKLHDKEGTADAEVIQNCNAEIIFE